MSFGNQLDPIILVFTARPSNGEQLSSKVSYYVARSGDNCMSDVILVHLDTLECMQKCQHFFSRNPPS